ncbi:MAG: tRNA dihydrouridine synthase DusB [Bacteroidales bacterium]|nr:tRNA dihydrouridine synthase DusB [Bacteroidales bacterium]
MNIGNIKLGNKPIFLAPMEDVTDPSFRFMCKKFGADIVYTEFISSDGLIRNGKKSLQKLEIFEYERPIGIQIYGHIPEAMLEAALLVEKAQPDFIDINFGCPVKKIANRGAGSGMMKNVPLMIEISKKIVDAVSLPVTVKTRLGWDNESKNIIDIALKLQDTGIKAITVHGRTRMQMYKGNADWELIGALKNHPDFEIPVIGNGDVTDAATAAENFKNYGVDGIMIGRASIGKPWIFKEIKEYLHNNEIIPTPNVSKRVDIAREHFSKSLLHKGEPRGIYEMRRHFSLYFKSIPNFKETRMKLVTSNNASEIFSILDEIKIKFGEVNLNQ